MLCLRGSLNAFACTFTVKKKVNPFGAETGIFGEKYVNITADDVSGFAREEVSMVVML